MRLGGSGVSTLQPQPAVASDVAVPGGSSEHRHAYFRKDTHTRRGPVASASPRQPVSCPSAWLPALLNFRFLEEMREK